MLALERTSIWEKSKVLRALRGATSEVEGCVEPGGNESREVSSSVKWRVTCGSLVVCRVVLVAEAVVDEDDGWYVARVIEIGDIS